MAFEDIKQALTDRQFSHSAKLPWMWVIDALAHSSQVDISLLLDLVKEIPETHGPIGGNAIELVALSLLECMIAQGDHLNSVSPASITKVDFDPSARCEDVLRQLMSEISESDQRTAGLETSKWNIKSFIEQKKSSLAKCSLQKLKDEILAGSHPVLASLAKKSGLLVDNQSDCEVQVDGRSSSELVENEKEICRLDEKFSVGDIVPCTNAEHSASKKLDDISNQTCNKEQLEDNEIEDARVDKEGVPELEAIGVTLESVQCNPDNGPINFQSGEFNMAFDSDDQSKRIESTDFALQKNVFDSQMLCKRDYLAKVDWRKLNLCMKCRRGGKLLDCSSTSCSSVVHESCLGSNESLDATRKFNCPYCACSLAFSKYLEAHKKVSMARKDLATFINWGNKQVSRDKFCKSPGIIQNCLEHENDLHQCSISTSVYVEKVHGKISGCDQVHPSLTSSDVKSYGKTVGSINDLTNNLSKDKQYREMVGQECQSLIIYGQHRMTATSNHESRGETININSEKEVYTSPERDFRSENPYLRSTKSSDTEDVSGDENENSGASKYFISYRQKECHISESEIPRLRRKRLPWTDEEELALKVPKEDPLKDCNVSDFIPEAPSN